MLMYFIKKRHGSVSVFCAIILIAILSFSSLMVEIGRMRSIEALFSEVMDNAAFSTLSNYDAALYKRFALMAINPDIDNETFNNYLTISMNQRNKDNKLIDMGGKVTTEATMDKVYDLADEDVLKSQIEELHKYRGVLDIASTYVDYEGAIEAIIGFFDKNMVYLQFFADITDRASVIIEYFTAIGKYYNATCSLDDMQEEYYDKADEFNTARKKYKKVMDNSKSTDAQKNDATTEYNSKKAELEKAIDDLHKTIYDLIDAEVEYQVALGKMTDDLVSSVISDELTALRNGGGNYESLTDEEKVAYEEFLLGMEADIDMSQGVFDKLSNFLQGKALEILKEYAKDVKASKSKISADKEYDEVEMGIIDEALCDISALCSTLFSIVDEVITLIVDIIKSIEVFLGFAECIEIYSQLNLGFSPYYTNNILGAGELPYGIEDLFGDYNDVDYSHILEPDKQQVIDEYSSSLAKKVAKEVDYNLAYINPGVNLEASLLGEIIAEFSVYLSEACSAITFLVKNCTNVLKYFKEIIDAFKQLINSLKKVLECIFEFVKLMASLVVDTITDMIYSHAIVANYAVGVFPNRTTEITDPNILGEEWSSYLDGWAPYDDMHLSGLGMISNTNFSKCRAEYIFAGTTDEVLNQRIVYFIMLAQRFSASTPALFTNDFVRDNLLKLCETGLGAIIAVVLAILYIYIEACMDMILLTYGAQEVPIIKVKPWLEVGGIMQFVGRLADIKAKRLTRATVCDWANTHFQTVGMFGGIGVKKLAGDKIDAKMQSFIDETYTHFGKDPSQMRDISGELGIPKKGSKTGKAMGWAYTIINILMPKWDYTDYLMMYIALLPEDIVLGRMENLIQLEMQQAYDKDFKLNEACTYMRVKGTVEYKPILPIPVLTDITPIKYEQIKYEGY